VEGAALISVNILDVIRESIIRGAQALLNIDLNKNEQFAAR